MNNIFKTEEMKRIHIGFTASLKFCFMNQETQGRLKSFIG